MNWLNRNSTKIIKSLYILPILIAAGVSIFHVVSWYGITNPVSWAIYLSVGVEIAALSALAGITTKISNSAYIPFLIVTFIQLIGNVFFAYQFIDITGPMFKDWVDLVGGLFGHGDLKFHRQILALIGGGLIPMISLSFLHLLVSFTNKSGINKTTNDAVTDAVTDGANDTVTDVDLSDVFTPKSSNKFDFDEIVLPPFDSSNEAKIETIPQKNEEDVDIEAKIETIPQKNEEDVDIEELIETHKKEKEKKISVDDIKEIKDKRNFSVNIPNRTNKVNNTIERIGSNKTLEKGTSNKITFKKG